jgi:phage tail-like protein
MSMLALNPDLHVGAARGLPHDPLALVLYGGRHVDAARAFAVGTLQDVEISAGCQSLVLAPSPAATRTLTEASGSFGGLDLPTNVAVARNGDIYLVDRTHALVKLFDPCNCEFRPLPCFSISRRSVPSPVQPPPAAPLNELSDPTGAAICGASLLVADRGHHRVVIVGLVGLVPRGALRLPASTGLRKLWSPFAVACHGKHIYVSDPDHGRVDRFDSSGRWIDAWLGLGGITHLAVDCEGTLIAVIEGFTADANGNRTDAAVELIDGKPEVLDPRAGESYRRFARPPLAIDREGRLHLGPLCSPPSDAVFDLQGIPVKANGRAAQPLFAMSGTYTSTPLDSRRRGCVWHRVVLAGALPADTRITIEATTSDVALNNDELDDLPPQAWSEDVTIKSFADGTADALFRSPPGRYLWLRLTLTGNGSATPSIERMVVEFPRVSLRRYLPSVYGMDPVSADFTDRFTAIYDTGLRSIESRLDTLHELFDPSTAPATRKTKTTPDGAPVTDFLTWLGTWIGVVLDRQWPEAARRAMLAAAIRIGPLRGTFTGLNELLLVFLGFRAHRCADACPQDRCTPRPLNCAEPPAECDPPMPPLILEHWRLRRWLIAGHGKLGDDSVLWGKRIVNRSELSGSANTPAGRSGNARVGPLSCPPDGMPATQLNSVPDPLHDPFLVYAHRATVFVPARVRRCDWQRRGLERLLAAEMPAHVAWTVDYVEPRFRVGVQATIGFDSVIARTPPGMRLGKNQLGQGTVLPPHPGRPSVVGVDARVGENTRL